MNRHRDPHQALKSEIVDRAQGNGVELLLARLQWSKDEIGYSLHANPNTFSTSGLQRTDFLALLGFQRQRCVFFGGRECYVHWTDADINVAGFARLFGRAFTDLQAAEGHLESCGFIVDQPEGWGYFFGKQIGSSRREVGMPGDGHTAMTTTLQNQSEDATFFYKLSWLESAHERGWTIHYRPKHPPLSSELQSVFAFLKIHEFAQCPQYDFEPCHWRSIAFLQAGDGIFGRNTEAVHRGFSAHAGNFSLGIEKLLKANAAVEEAGFRLLPLAQPAARLNADIQRRISRAPDSRATALPSNYDVALSFAGTERAYAERLAVRLKDAGFSVFYDDFYPEFLWGKNLIDTFDEIYRKRARYCVIFVSKDYKDRAWTNHERRSAQARALVQKGDAYILPIKVDESELDGMPPTVGYLPLTMGIDKIGDLLMIRLQAPP